MYERKDISGPVVVLCILSNKVIPMYLDVHIHNTTPELVTVTHLHRHLPDFLMVPSSFHNLQRVPLPPGLIIGPSSVSHAHLVSLVSMPSSNFPFLPRRLTGLSIPYDLSFNRHDLQQVLLSPRDVLLLPPSPHYPKFVTSFLHYNYLVSLSRCVV